MNDQVKESLKQKSAWLRLFFIMLFVFICYVALGLTALVVMFQIIYPLLTGKPNEKVLPFSRQLTAYIRDILYYLTYISDQRPFPFSDWPVG